MPAKMNMRSSRSHTIFRLVLESKMTDGPDKATVVSIFNLVDLAGSESVKKVRPTVLCVRACVSGGGGGLGSRTNCSRRCN